MTKINSKINSSLGETVNALLESEKFNDLPKELQDKVLNNVTEADKRRDGIIGVIVGTGANVAVNTAVLLSACVFLYWIMCGLGLGYDIELVKVLAPIVTMSLGYVFGKISEAK